MRLLTPILAAVLLVVFASQAAAYGWWRPQSSARYTSMLMDDNFLDYMNGPPTPKVKPVKSIAMKHNVHPAKYTPKKPAASKPKVTTHKKKVAPHKHQKVTHHKHQSKLTPHKHQKVTHHKHQSKLTPHKHQNDVTKHNKKKAACKCKCKKQKKCTDRPTGKPTCNCTCHKLVPYVVHVDHWSHKMIEAQRVVQLSCRCDCLRAKTCGSQPKCHCNCLTRAVFIHGNFRIQMLVGKIRRFKRRIQHLRRRLQSSEKDRKSIAELRNRLRIYTQYTDWLQRNLKGAEANVRELRKNKQQFTHTYY